MLGIGVFGATGRVGGLLIGEILSHKKCNLASVYVRNELQYNIPSNTLVTQDMQAFVESSEVIIDFSSPEATQILLETILRIESKKLPSIVIGTTGLDSNQKDLLQKASAKVPILYSANMSYGIAILERIANIVSKELRAWDIEISEIHHRYKKDAPSGTALMLANSILEARELDEKALVYDRKGVKPREKDDISLVSLRGGDVVGKHTIGIYGDGEYLELTHNATSRLTFAKGALNAAFWLVEQKNGLYSMKDIFNIS